ncbi:MAG: energy transducer TonB [Treponema sp.]|nr:energy transducer TonB [Treponema sp.]
MSSRIHKPAAFREKQLRLFLFLAAAALHGVLLYFVAFTMQEPPKNEEPLANVMRLVDVQEEPPAPLPPPPPKEEPPAIVTNTVEAVAESMIETDEVPEQVVVSSVPYREADQQGEAIDYLPMNRISVLPVFPEDQIRRNTVYPPIALRSGIEGIVYLELFVDRQGNIRQVSILRENPQGRGFGEAAVNAFKGITGKPAESNGEPVAVRFRYPVRFTIR